MTKNDFIGIFSEALRIISGLEENELSVKRIQFQLYFIFKKKNNIFINLNNINIVKYYACIKLLNADVKFTNPKIRSRRNIVF